MSKVFSQLQAKFGGRDQVLVKVLPPESELNLSACNQLDISIPNSPISVNGNIRVGVKCLQANSWTVYLSANIQQKKTFFVTSRALPYGQALKSDDFSTKTDFPDNIPIDALFEMRQIVGRTLIQDLPAETVITSKHFSSDVVITNGQTVKVAVSGKGFKIMSEGKAMSNATIGQSVKIKLNSGQIVTGLAQSQGFVEIIK